MAKTNSNSSNKSINEGASKYVPLLINESLENGINSSEQLAYILATARHETRNFTKLNEQYNGDPKTYFNNKYGDRSDLGNRLFDQEGNPTNDGYNYRGRGFVQITGRANYEKFGQKLGIDLINNPDLAADPDIAAKIAVIGMRDGMFTGKKLSDFINDNNKDYTNARKIVNGKDKADLIKGYADSFENGLKDSNVLKGQDGNRKVEQPTNLQNPIDLESQKAAYQERYQQLAGKVIENPEFAGASSRDIDLGVAVCVVQERKQSSGDLNLEETNNEIAGILSQSSQVKEWKETLNRDDYLESSTAYIEDIQTSCQKIYEQDFDYCQE